MGSGTLYRGGFGMWSWVAHRISGVGIFFFLLVHVLDTAMVRVDPEAYNAVMATYKNPIMGIGEMGLVAGIVYHAFNGVRIILVDFWSNGANHQKKLFWAVAIAWLVVMVPFAIVHVYYMFIH
ncbi:succinate dehydrogenase, cytochrome b556 subunit [Kocuria sp. SL71]|uniref:succinate dehydrogenase, cytochrome b556 subunit n=2 Tax=Micrococcaceae TaxID=1268 RepID=UPI0022725BF7|nr:MULTISPECIES: succinate dehydrogenase, cytochrome b556 subunit [Kocuria]MCY1682902.1 succinate dehydrogenase, cytochrome b556 subunit [Kocuria sp. SL71]